LADAYLILGFLLMVTGVALWSVAAACLFAGALLFLCGGLMKAGSGGRSGA
jgi:hypothetical protein